MFKNLEVNLLLLGLLLQPLFAQSHPANHDVTQMVSTSQIKWCEFNTIQKVKIIGNILGMAVASDNALPLVQVE